MFGLSARRNRIKLIVLLPLLAWRLLRGARNDAANFDATIDEIAANARARSAAATLLIAAAAAPLLMTIEPPSTTPLVTPNQPLIVTGTPIDSSEARPGVVHGRPIGRRPSMQMARQISGVIEQRSQGRAGQGFRMLFNFAAGVLLPLYALYVYSTKDAILIGGRPAPVTSQSASGSTFTACAG